MFRKKILMLYTIRSADKKPIVCLVNPTDSYRPFEKYKVIAEAHEEENILEEQPADMAISRSEVITQVQFMLLKSLLDLKKMTRH